MCNPTRFTFHVSRSAPLSGIIRGYAWSGEPDVSTAWWKVDMHSHTRLSKDSLNDPRELVRTAAARGLGALCVTDHNGLANALALARLPDLPIPVIPSEEVKTSEGE